MPNNYNDEYQYNSCISRGICSVNPKTSSLQEVLVMYLANIAHYVSKLQELGYENVGLKNLILNTISIMVSNPDFSEQDFQTSVDIFKNEFPKLVNKYTSVCSEQNITPAILQTDLEYDNKTDIIQSIREGEKANRTRSLELTEELRSLYQILFILLKSMCVNVQTLESYNKNTKEGYSVILKLLDSVNNKLSENEILKLITDASKTDNELVLSIVTSIEERYGEPDTVSVSYSTIPAKAIMVVGSNLRELEKILDETKNQDIDVYSHDEMVLAHTYPKFKEYKHLKGQFGQGYENCLLDFSTFPGPIILTKHSLFNVEHFYRGQLYTTDNAYSKGVIPIKDDNYKNVIDAAKNSKGFKNGKKCESEKFGFNTKSLVDRIKTKINSDKFSHIFIVEPWDKESKNYISNLLTRVPDNVLLISLAPCEEKSNIISVNACFNSRAILELVSKIKLSEDFKEIKITVFIPKCDRYTISKIIYLTSFCNISVYLGKCNPMILNTSVIKKLEKSFNIKSFSSVKRDLNDINCK